MNVVLLTEHFYPNRGGVQNYLEHLVRNLSKHTITIIAPKQKNITEINIPGAVIVRQKFFRSWMKPKWLCLFYKLWKMARAEKMDLLLCGKALFEGQVGYYLNKYLGTPYIIFTYGMEIEVWKSNPRAKKQLIRVLSRADRVAYINQVTKTALHELGVDESRLVEILPGVDDRYFEPITEEKINNVVKKYHLTQPYVLTVARLVKRKGLDKLIEAFAKLEQIQFSNVQLVIVGSGPESVHLAEEAEQNLIAPYVKLLGDVPDEDLPALYSGATVFALTPQPLNNDIEGFGIVYLEAAACGVPAVATNIGGVPEAVVNGETGILAEPDSVKPITDALTDILSDGERRRVLGAKARLRADQNFRWSKRVQFLEAAIDSLVDSHQAKV